MLVNLTEKAPIPDGTYVAEVVNIEETEGIYGPQLCWMFRVVAPEKHAGALVSGWTSQSADTRGKLAQWAAACLGRDLHGGVSFDTDQLVGRKLKLTVTVEQSKQGALVNKIQSAQACVETEKDDPFADS